MDKVFIPTNNYNRMVQAVGALSGRDPSLPGLGLVYGKYGYGKSEAVTHFFGTSDVQYIRVERLWRPRRLLEEIVDVYNLGEPEYRLDRLSDQVSEGMKRWKHPLFIDDADYLFKEGIMLDVVRDIHEKSRVPIILIGMERSLKKLSGYGHIFSRVLPAGIVEFQPVTPPELVLIVKRWTGLSMGMDTAELFCHYTEGDFRFIVGYLLSIEDACRINSETEITVRLIESVVNRVNGGSRVKKIAAAGATGKTDPKNIILPGGKAQ